MKIEIGDGELWSFLRDVLTQGVAIHQDHYSKTYEEYSVRLDTAAHERVGELATRVAKSDGNG